LKIYHQNTSIEKLVVVNIRWISASSKNGGAIYVFTNMIKLCVAKEILASSKKSALVHVVIDIENCALPKFKRFLSYQTRRELCVVSIVGKLCVFKAKDSYAFSTEADIMHHNSLVQRKLYLTEIIEL
jgi:hypothetical protein